MTQHEALQSGTPKHIQTREAVLEDLWVHFPQHCLVLTDPGARAAVDIGIARAQRHGFHAQADVSAFVSLMVLLGVHFDEDPQLPWAGASLRKHNAANRRDAMAALLATSAARMEPMIGPDGALYRRALAWVLHHDFDEIAAHSEDDPGLHQLLGLMFRPKYELLGEPAVQQLIEHGRSLTHAHGLTTNAGVGVWVMLMFLLGRGFDQDPFHPWASRAVQRRTAENPTDHAGRLHASGLLAIRRYARLTRVQRNSADERLRRHGSS
ncbi:MAG: hypothetical protein ACRBN8_06090 [Nannocystales bacterium]